MAVIVVISAALVVTQVVIPAQEKAAQEKAEQEAREAQEKAEQERQEAEKKDEQEKRQAEDLAAHEKLKDATVGGTVFLWHVCVFMQTRKGYVDTNRFAQTEKFPIGYFSLIAGLTGVLSAFAVAVMRCIAEVQIVPLESVYWGANVACGVFFGVFIFAATLLAFYLSFAFAKRNRKRIEAELEE